MSTELPREEQAHLYDLRDLYENSRMLSSSLDLDYLLRNLVLSAMTKLKITRSVVLLHEPKDSTLRVAVARGMPGLKVDQVLEADPEAKWWTEDQALPELAAQGVVRVLPIQSSGRHIGLIGIGQKMTRQPFTDAELEYVQALAHMSAVAIDNLLMINELQQANQNLDARVQQLKTLFELSQEFNATVDKDRVVKQFAFAMLGHMAAQRYVFYLRNPEGQFELVSSRSAQDAVLSAAFLSGLQGLVLTEEDQPGSHPELEAHGFVVALPIRLKDLVQGILCIGPKSTRIPYSPDDIEFLYSLGSLAVVSIQNVDLIEERIEKQRLQEELSMARGIQKRLLPGSIPQAKRLEIASMALSSREVGGDYFDVLSLTDERLLVMVADVTGKGMPAALLMSTIHACTHLMRPMKMTLAESIDETNRVVYDNTDPDKFITAFASIYFADGSLEYVNAGHEPPMLIRSSGAVERLDVGGPLLGVVPGVRYASGRVVLEAGDMVVLFTDGVTEAMGETQEEYTESRLQDLVLEHQQCSALELLERIQESVESFTGPVQALSDDRTLLVLKALE